MTTEPLCPECQGPAHGHYNVYTHPEPRERVLRCAVGEVDIYRHALTEMQAELQASQEFGAAERAKFLKTHDALRVCETERDALRAENAKLRTALEASKPRPAVLPDLDLGYDAATCDVCGAPQTGEEVEEPLCDKCWNERAALRPSLTPEGNDNGIPA